MLGRFALIITLLFVYSFSATLAPVYAKSHHAAPAPPAQTNTKVTVWVNLKTGIYHYPGTRWYGKTESGAYMSEDDAKAKGYRAAENGQ